jgi:hypothetical protein
LETKEQEERGNVWVSLQKKEMKKEEETLRWGVKETIIEEISWIRSWGEGLPNDVDEEEKGDEGGWKEGRKNKNKRDRYTNRRMERFSGSS